MTGCHSGARSSCLHCNRSCRTGIYLSPPSASAVWDLTPLCAPDVVLSDDVCQLLTAQRNEVVVSLAEAFAADALTASIEKLRHYDVTFRLLVWGAQDHLAAPQSLYRYWRNLGASVIHLLPPVERDEVNPGVTAQRWANFLRSIFELWVREDVGRVSVQVFDDALAVWRGTGVSIAIDTLPAQCQRCPALRLCNGDCPKHRLANGRSALCEGYQDFFTWSAPYMRVMRDLLAQHRSPVELMVMLRQQPI